MTHIKTETFHYPLQVLVNKHGWDVDTLSAELTTARQALKSNENEMTRLQQALQSTNQSIANLRADGVTLDLTRERVLSNYRQVQEEMIEAQANQVRSATAQCEQIVAQLTRTRQTLRGFEKHSDRLRAAHAVEAGRAAARDADDAWLVMREWKGGIDE